MKRVGKTPAQLVRSASRRGKSSSRFQFDITVERIYGCKAGSSYLVKWARGVKVAQTKAAACTKETAGKLGLPVNQKISLMVTLYREDGKKFDSKDAKLSVVTVNPNRKQERTAAKIHFDLGAFAGVPSSSTAKVFKMSDKMSVRATVESRFVKAGGSGTGSGGASSALSGMTGVSGRSSDEEDDIGDDFGDLALEDVPEPEVLISSSAKTRGTPGQGQAKPESPSGISAAASLEAVRSEKLPPSFGKGRRNSMALEPPANSVPNVTAEAKPLKPSPPSAPIDAAPVETPASTLQRESIPFPIDTRDTGMVSKEVETKIAELTRQSEQLRSELHVSKEGSRKIQQSLTSEIDRLKAKIDEQSREAASIKSSKASSGASLTEATRKNVWLEAEVRKLNDELSASKKSESNAVRESKALAAVEERNKELSREVDRLTIAAATPSNRSANEGSTSEVEKRLLSLRQEKEAAETKSKAYEAHSVKVRSTYEKLSQMYDDLRDHNSALQKELDETKAMMSQRSLSDANEAGSMDAELDEARQQVKDVEASKQSLQSDHDRLLAQVASLQERLESTSRLLEQSQQEVDELLSETRELKGQRDMAMQRALSRGKSNNGSEGSSSKSIGKAEEELRVAKDKYEREQNRLARRITELEAEVTELREDVEYEKAEKLKARDDRDKIRENARELERKTSHVAKQTDAMNVLKRQVSTHQMREQDHESMISQLREEISRLQAELDSLSILSKSRGESGNDEVGEILQDLVATKLALAEAEDDKLNLQFTMKTLKKSEKGIQERLAAHASRLEVKLGQANEQLDRLRKNQQAEGTREFTELGSDVDY